MEFRALASSSKGNCYRVTGGGSSLLLECGVPFKEIQRALYFGVSNLAGCLITHEHGDHAKAARDILRAGVDCYCSKGTAEALGLEGHRLHVVKAKTGLTIGAWSVMPFDTVHDAAEPLGFLLSCGTERLLFATDTAYVKYRFPGLTHIAIECNYDLGILKRNVAAGLVEREVKKRVLRSHMNLGNVKEFLRANDLTRLQAVYLLHLSDENADEALFKRTIQQITGKPVCVAPRS